MYRVIVERVETLLKGCAKRVNGHLVGRTRLTRDIRSETERNF